MSKSTPIIIFDIIEDDTEYSIIPNNNKINKIEFEEADCKFTNSESTLSVDRYMPNLWLRNQTISYYVSSGVNTLNFANKAPSKFTISYTDKDPILVSNAPRKSISFILLLCCSSVILFMS